MQQNGGGKAGIYNIVHTYLNAQFQYIVDWILSNLGILILAFLKCRALLLEPMYFWYFSVIWGQGTLGNRFFCLGGLPKGVGAFLKPIQRLLFKKKPKFQNLTPDLIEKYPIFSITFSYNVITEW